NDHAMAYYSARCTVVLFGGSVVGGPEKVVWEYDGTSWLASNIGVVPPPRSRHAMAYDSARDRVVLFGGVAGSNGPYLADTWEWDGTAWVSVTPTVSPPARSHHAM